MVNINVEETEEEKRKREEKELAEIRASLNDPLAYNIVNPNGRYNGTEIINNSWVMRDRRKYGDSVEKSGKEGKIPVTGDIEDFFERVLGKKLAEKYALRFDSKIVPEIAKNIRRNDQANAATFVRKNLDRCMTAIKDSRIGGKILADLILNAKMLYRLNPEEWSNPEAHNEVYERVMSKKELENAIGEFQKGNKRNLEDICKESVDKRGWADWVKKLVKYMWDDAVVGLLASSESANRQVLAEKSITKNGKVDIDKSGDIVRNSYIEGWRLHDDEKNPSTQSDIRKYKLNPKGEELYHVVAAAEHPDYDKDVMADRDYRDQVTRFKEREWAGVGQSAPDEEDWELSHRRN